MLNHVAYLSTLMQSTSQPESPTLEDVSPLSISASNKIEYRDLIYISLDIEGKDYTKSVSGVLNSQSTMCYLTKDSLGLNISEDYIESSSIYGCGEYFEITFNDYPESFEAMLLFNYRTKYEAMIGLNYFIQHWPQITLVPELVESPKLNSVEIGTESITYPISQGFISQDPLTKFCDGSIAEFETESTNSNTCFFCIFPSCEEYEQEEFFGAHIKLIQGSEIQNLVGFISWDTTLAQTEISSLLIEKLDFVDLEIRGTRDWGMPIRIKRADARIVDGNNPDIKIGVDIMRHYVMEFSKAPNSNQKFVKVCRPKIKIPAAEILATTQYETKVSSELHGIASHINRDPPVVENISILIEYTVAVTVSILINGRRLWLAMDTGSSITHLPEYFFPLCHKGDSSFYCQYGDGTKSYGKKASLTVAFPVRKGSKRKGHRTLLSKKYSTLIAGINKVDDQYFGTIGLRYLMNSESLAYLWNAEWMIFVPEIIKDSSNKDGFSSGRLELSKDFIAMKLCQGDVIALKANRSTWIVEKLVIVINVAGREEEYHLRDVLIDTGATESYMNSSSDLAKINKASSIKLKSALSGTSVIELENHSFFKIASDGKNLIGINILQNLVVGLGMNPNDMHGNQGDALFCIPKQPTSFELKQGLLESERDKLQARFEEWKSLGVSYECKMFRGFSVFHEILRNS
jgi:hypothetical protein